MKKELTYLETLKMIGEIKRKFEHELESRLSIMKVPCPLFVKSSSGLQDDLSGTEEAVSFISDDTKFEIVHSLAKWKREALYKYSFMPSTGLYTDMKAIRKDETIDAVHSLYVEQWDWEKVILKSDRTISYLKETVRSIYKAFRSTLVYMKKKYPFLTLDLPKTITFITTQELETMYPDKTPKEREKLITEKYKAVFIIGIGDKLLSGIPHDLRSPDYDDWSLDGDILIYDKVIDDVVEISSMGIRVDESSLLEQLKKTKKEVTVYHKKMLDKTLPYTIGGGIGVSRVLMLILGKKDIREVQASSWSISLKEIKEL